MNTEIKIQSIRIAHLISIIKTLDRFTLRFSRSYYYDLLKREIEFNLSFHREFVNQIFSLIPLDDVLSFFYNSAVTRPLTLRCNSLKSNFFAVKRYLRDKKINCYKIEQSKGSALLIKATPVRVTKTSGFLAGLFTVQGLPSIMTVLTLQPQKTEKILDLASSPGGKTTHISQLMNNSGFVVANEKSNQRISALISNIHRLSVRNTIVSNYDGVFFKHIMCGFDRVLIDVPCSGTGLTSNDSEIKKKALKNQLFVNCEIQKKLLISAIDCCERTSRTGGCIVYSTCSLLVEENESIIQHAIDKRSVKVVPTGINIGMPGIVKYKSRQFSPSMSECKRFYPHIHNLDGFFICKLIKV